jgi:hypothetical protein
MLPKKPNTLGGFEPGSSCSWGGCDVHCVGRFFNTMILPPWFLPTYAQVLLRVARWFVFKPKIPNWLNFGGSCYGKSLYILWPFGLFYGHWKYFMAIWYIFPRFGILDQENSGNPCPSQKATSNKSNRAYIPCSQSCLLTWNPQKIKSHSYPSHQLSAEYIIVSQALDRSGQRFVQGDQIVPNFAFFSLESFL